MEARTAIAGAITMTITVSPARNEYTANAGQTIFNYTFKIFQNTDLNVYVTPAGKDANDSTDLTTLYTVTGIGDEDGGSITLAIPTNANDLVTIVSNIPSSRTTDYQNNGDFRPNVVNNDFDRVVSLVKKVEDRTNRGLLLPESQQDPKPLSLPIPKAGMPVRWNGDESGLENYDNSTVSNEEIANDKVVINYKTLLEARSDPSLKLNQSLNVKERELGKGGGAFWDVVLSSSVTVNFFDIVQSLANPDISLVLRVDGVLDARQIGLFPSGDQTFALKHFWGRVLKEKIKGILYDGTYNYNDELVNISDPSKCIVICRSGKAKINYTGDPIGVAIRASNCDAAQVHNVEFENNNNVANPIYLTKTSAVIGSALFLGFGSYNTKQAGSVTTNPAGALISGEFKNVDFINSIIEKVDYENPLRSSTGLGVINFSGKCKIINCLISEVLTPSGVDADGIKVFGKEFALGSTPTSGQAYINGCTLHDCQGRAVKMQIRNWEATGNTVSLSDGFETITEWRGFDGQDGGGNVHGNKYKFGADVVFGNAAKLVQFSNSRNDGVSKVSRFEKNEVDSKTAGLSLIAGINISYGDHVIVIDENVYRGATISRGVQFRAQEGVANIDSVVIKCRDNDFVDLTNQDLFLPFDAVDFGDKLFLEFTGNDVQNKASLSRFYNSLAGFSVNNNFKVNNNVAVTDRIDWPFDMNGLPGGNSFLFGTQTINNIAGGIGTFGYIVTDGSIQRTLSNSAAVEARRADGGAWVTV